MNTRFIPFSLDETSMESLSIFITPKRKSRSSKTIRAVQLKLHQWKKKKEDIINFSHKNVTDKFHSKDKHLVVAALGLTESITEKLDLTRIDSRLNQDS